MDKEEFDERANNIRATAQVGFKEELGRAKVEATLLLAEVLNEAVFELRYANAVQRR